MQPYIPAIATVIAALIGGYVVFRVHDRNARKAAATKLISAFSGALGYIEVATRFRDGDPDRPDISEILKAALPAHAAAVEEFRPFVRPKDRRAYQQAWQQYRDIAQDKDDIGAVFHAECASGDWPYTYLRTRIRAITSFADA